MFRGEAYMVPLSSGPPHGRTGSRCSPGIWPLSCPGAGLDRSVHRSSAPCLTPLMMRVQPSGPVETAGRLSRWRSDPVGGTVVAVGFWTIAARDTFHVALVSVGVSGVAPVFCGFLCAGIPDGDGRRHIADGVSPSSTGSASCGKAGPWTTCSGSCVRRTDCRDRPSQHREGALPSFAATGVPAGRAILLQHRGHLHSRSRQRGGTGAERTRSLSWTSRAGRPLPVPWEGTVDRTGAQAPAGAGARFPRSIC